MDQPDQPNLAEELSDGHPPLPLPTQEEEEENMGDIDLFTFPCINALLA